MSARLPVLLLIAVSISGCIKMPSQPRGTISLNPQHPTSKRYAILEEQGGTAYLYLTTPGRPRPEKDVVVFARTKLGTLDGAKAAAMRGQAPPLAKDYATESAIVANPQPDEFRVQWSADGHSVALLRADVPLAMIVPELKHGSSKAISKTGPFGDPWDQAAYDRVFAGGN